MKKNIINFFYAIDKRLWGDEIYTNRYLATLSLLFVALLGAMQGGGSILNSWFGWDVEMNIISTIGLSILVFGYNLFESIVSAKPKIAILRSLLLLLCFVAAFVLGYVFAAVVLFAVAAIVVIGFIGAALGGGSKSGRATVTDEYGHETEVKKDMFGTYHDSYGNTYTDNQNGTATKND